MKIINIPQLSTELEQVPVKIKDNKKVVNYFEDGVQAGFPSPAEDFKAQKLSLDEKYLNNPDATFIVRVKGESMYPTLMVNDLLIVKSDIPLTDNKIAIISVNQTEFTVKRFDKNGNTLLADNPNFENIPIQDDDTILCLGVVKHIIRDV